VITPGQLGRNSGVYRTKILSKPAELEDEQRSIADMMKKIGEEMCNKTPDNGLGNAIKRDWESDAKAAKVMDIGIASASAAKTAMDHNVDNRVMYKAGVAASRLDILNKCNLIIGIPLSATGKNIYFDRTYKLDALKIIKLIKK
jgi:hypothetical protein